jgi:predicted pyridoxine 5'-phosphate oxidase superfamily flavin-nucleotide-binding protein
MSQNFYHDGSRRLQDAFDSRRLADRLESARMHVTWSQSDREIIAAAAFFFLATADADGRPDCSIKGGMPGFVTLTADDRLEFPDYDGNGMYRSLGNILVNPHVGLLFVELTGERRKLRINGRAQVIEDPPRVARHHAARLVVEVTAGHIFPNCPRYLPELVDAERAASEKAVSEPAGRETAGILPSVYAPRPGYLPPEPLWKSKPDLKEVLPAARPPIGAHDGVDDPTRK